MRDSGRGAATGTRLTAAPSPGGLLSPQPANGRQGNAWHMMMSHEPRTVSTHSRDEPFALDREHTTERAFLPAVPRVHARKGAAFTR
jgi:hypothetical protein